MAAITSSSARPPSFAAASMSGMNDSPASEKTRRARADRSCAVPSFAISLTVRLKPSSPAAPVSFVIFWNASAICSGAAALMPSTLSALESFVISSARWPACMATSER